MSLTPIQETTVIDYYNAKETLRNIEVLTGHGQATILRVLKKHGVVLRGSHQPKLSLIKRKRLVKDYKSNIFTIKQLEKKYGVLRQVIYTYLNEFHVSYKNKKKHKGAEKKIIK